MNKSSDFLMVFPDDEQGRKEMAEAMKRRVKVSARDYIYFYFSDLVTLLTGVGQKMKLVTLPEYEERMQQVMADIKTPEQQLGDFFKPLINNIKLFQDEVLLDERLAEIEKEDNNDVQGI